MQRDVPRTPEFFFSELEKLMRHCRLAFVGNVCIVPEQWGAAEKLLFQKQELPTQAFGVAASRVQFLCAGPELGDPDFLFQKEDAMKT